MARTSLNHDGTYSTEILENRGWIYWRNERGQIHREDGPAVIQPNGDEEWHFKGRYLNNTNGSAAIELKSLVEEARVKFALRTQINLTADTPTMARIRIVKKPPQFT